MQAPPEGAARDPAAASAASAGLGVVRFLVDPNARVVTDGDVGDSVLTLGIWRSSVEISGQLRRASAEGLASWSVVPGPGSSVQVDLRLTPEVKAAEVIRRGPEVLEIQLSETRFAGASVRVRAQLREEAAARAGEAPDTKLRSILDEPGRISPTWVQYPPFLLPVGPAGPMRNPVRWEVRPRTWGRVPTVIREGWSASPPLREAVLDAEDGSPVQAVMSIKDYPTPDDAARIAYALARGWILGQVDPATGQPVDPGRAGDSYLLAAGLAPDADWAAWARGRAAYHQEHERRFDESQYQARRAAQLRPEDPERPHWEVGAGISLVGRERWEEGIEQITSWLGGVPALDESVLFEGRRAVLVALWNQGDAWRAARVLDLLREEHPTLTNDPAWDEEWGLLLLDAGRYPEARGYFERLERTADTRVLRERSRWWLHEAAMGAGNLLEARRALRRLLEQTPGSALGPLTQMRLEILDLLAADPKERAIGWPELAVKLQEKALLWPQTSLELEALSLTAQIWLDEGLYEDGLRLYEWVDERGQPNRSALAFRRVLCEHAPAAFRSLRARDEHVAALGVWRRYLERPEMRTCVDPLLRADAAATALTAGLPEIALTWLGQAVAEGQRGRDDAYHLSKMAAIYLEEGRVDVARRTMEFLRTSELPVDEVQVEEVWGNLLVAEGRPAEALEHYDRAVAAAASSARRRPLIPELRLERGKARALVDDRAGATEDLRFALENKAGTDPVGNWLLVARLEQRFAETESDAKFTPRTAAAERAWKAVEGAIAAARALDVEPSAEQDRALTWFEASAKLALGKEKRARKLLQELGKGSDAWGLRARNRLGSLDVEQALDARTTRRQR